MRVPKYQTWTTNLCQTWTKRQPTRLCSGDALPSGRPAPYWPAVLLGVLLLATAPLVSSYAQTAPPGHPLTEADQVLAFADALFNEGDYYRAITEYKRFLFLVPADARAGRVQLQVGRSYLG